MSPRNPLVAAHFGGAAFDLPGPANSPGDTQSSSIVLPGTILQKEVVSKTVRQPNNESTVLSISQPCTAVDVFADLRNLVIGSGIFIVRIYAIEGGVRTVVGRGRINNASAFLPPEARIKWAAGARCAASRFEITLQRDPIGGAVAATDTAEFPISAIGYQATGSHPLSPPLRFQAGWLGLVGEFQISAASGEVDSANGTNAEAAGTPARFIQFWDTTGAAGTGLLIDEIVSKPQDSWSVDYGSLPLLFTNGLVLGNSTTTAVFTANGPATGFFALEAR